MTDGLGWVEGAAEVAIFEGEVGGDEDLVTAGRAEDGTVVTYAQGYEFVADGGGCPADMFYQSELSYRFARRFGHAESRIRGGTRWYFCGRNPAMQKSEFGCTIVTRLLSSNKTLKKDL
jgi:hypothetical protein